MTEQEALESAAIHSISQAGFKIHDWRKRPFRAPHHTASAVALVGGGSQPRPGEISLAHHGVLFLDELPEYNRHVLDVLREPLESGSITISRAARQAQYPSRFQFIAAMNPCPCGYLGDGSDRCHCTAEQIQRYRSRVSGPLLDRIDMHIEVPRLSQQQLREMRESNPVSSAEIRSRTIRARGIQLRRCNKANSQLENREIDAYCSLSADDMALLEKAIEKLGLSARAYHRILRVARTIADLGESENIITSHITEALTYRRLDRRGVSA
jgi:magnesium chelatase family protein